MFERFLYWSEVIYGHILQMYATSGVRYDQMEGKLCRLD